MFFLQRQNKELFLTLQLLTTFYSSRTRSMDKEPKISIKSDSDLEPVLLKKTKSQRYLSSSVVISQTPEKYHRLSESKLFLHVLRTVTSVLPFDWESYLHFSRQIFHVFCCCKLTLKMRDWIFGFSLCAEIYLLKSVLMKLIRNDDVLTCGNWCKVIFRLVCVLLLFVDWLWYSLEL